MFSKHLIEGDETPSLYKHCEKQIVVEQKSSRNHNTPLWDESQDSKSGGALIIELVNCVEVNTIVVSVVFSHEMVQVSFVQELVPIYVIEKASKCNEGRGGNQGEGYPVGGEKVSENAYFTLKDLLFITINEQIENEAVDYWVDFEMNAEPVN